MSPAILLWEYISGGGMAAESLPASLLSEGIAMLRAIATDFARAGFELTILLDARLGSLKQWLPRAHFRLVKQGDNIQELLSIQVNHVGSFLIIAPEFDGILLSFTRLLEARAINWGCPSEFIKIFSNKWNTWDFWKSRGVKTPNTWKLPENNPIDTIRNRIIETGGKIVIKPSSGTGAENIFLCNETNLRDPHYISALAGVLKNTHYIAQDFVPGLPLSANFLIIEKKIVPVCVNEQIITLSDIPGGDSHYVGGRSPAKDLCKKVTPETIQLALEKLASCFPTIESGIFGVDFMYNSQGEFIFIEVNARVTTSYVALSQVLSQNPITLMKGRLFPPSLGVILRESNNIIHYQKLEFRPLTTSGMREYEKIRVLKPPKNLLVEFACPPIRDPFGSVACFMSVSGPTCDILDQNIQVAERDIKKKL